MADNIKSKSIFAAVATFVITAILFTTIGAYVFDLATAGSPGITKATTTWANTAALQFLQAIKAIEGVTK